MISERPVVVGLGMCSSCGSDYNAAFDSLVSKKDFLQTQNLFDSPKHAHRLFAVAKGFNTGKKHYSRCANIMLEAVSSAMSGLNLSGLDKRRISVFVGTSIGGVYETENALVKLLLKNSEELGPLRFYECSTLSDIAAKKIGAKGCAMTFSTACSSSSLALSAACNAIAQKEADLCLVCGVDALSRITVNGFGSLLLLSADKCKPFDKHRDGITLGEAAGAIVLSSESAAKKLGLKIHSYALSWGCNADAYHATAPLPGGEGVANLITEILNRANLSSTDSIAAHGTGTLGNDSAEYAAYKAVFGDNIPPYHSNKRLFGHTLGASGVVNAIIGICSINRNILPPTPGFSTPIDGMQTEPLKDAKNGRNESVLALSLGFGGNNSGIILSKRPNEHKMPFYGGPFYVHSVGISSPLGVSLEEVSKNIASANSFKCDTERNLESIPPLKKRKFARLQKMVLSSGIKAVEDAKEVFKNPLKTAVCIGTGLGMVCETGKFIENAIINREAAPMPTAFTNSVHNAMSSAAAIHFGFKGLNSAATAKEISFESALWQAMSDMRLGASNCALVGAADEYSQYAERFLKTRAIYCKNFSGNLSEGAVLYSISPDKLPISMAKISLLKIGRRGDSQDEEANLIGLFLKDFPEYSNGIRCCFTPSAVNKFQGGLFQAAATVLKAESTFIIEDVFGKSYMNSAYAYALAKLKGKGLYASWSLSSSNLRALTLFEIL